MVEAVAINRWATKAIDNTLPGIFMSLVLNLFDVELQSSIGALFFIKKQKNAILDNKIPKTDVRDMLYESYGCVDNAGTVDLGNQYKHKIDILISSPVLTFFHLCAKLDLCFRRLTKKKHMSSVLNLLTA